MKKTIHINLSGMAFIIEEDAYDKLNGYLNAVEVRLGGGDEAKETLDDIEIRIAELFAPLTHNSGVAIKLEDVEEVIKILGNPEDYETGNEEEAKSSVKPPPVIIPRRLYRDPNSRVLGGVCSGLGAYFNIDPIVFRLLFVLGLFYGVSVLPYIILWIAIPKALTMEQRMQMYGGDYGINKGKAQSSAIRFEQPSPVNNILRAVGIVIGIFLIVVTFFAMIGVTIAMAFTGAMASFIPEIEWMRGFPELVIGPVLSLPAFLGIMMFLGIPLLMIFYLGLDLIFQFQKGGKMIGAIGLVLWLTGIGLIVYSGMNIASQFSISGSVSETTILKPFDSDTLFVEHITIPDNINRQRVLDYEGLEVLTNDKNLFVEGKPELEIISDADRLAITVEKSSKGSNLPGAINNAKGVDYIWLQKDSAVQLDRLFSIEKGTPLRAQKVRVILEIPRGKIVKTNIELSINQ